jgi:hypothetical protein
MPLVTAQYKFVMCQPDSQHNGCLVAADIWAAQTDITPVAADIWAAQTDITPEPQKV